MTNPRLRVLLAAALISLGGGALAACSPREGAAKSDAAQPVNQTLAQGLDGRRDLSTLKSVAENGDLGAVFSNPGSYTVLAPTNAAFEAAGGEDLTGEDLGAQAAALVRAHILPGALSRRDIEAAIARAENGQVRMTTMDDAMVTFARSGDTLTVTTPDGATARLTGEEGLMNNGVIQPVDAVLVRAQAPATTASTGQVPAPAS